MTRNEELLLDQLVREWLEAEEQGRWKYGAYLFTVAVNYFIYVRVRKRMP